MRLTSVRIAGVVLLAFLVLGTSPPRDFEDAESLLGQERFQEALGIYERVLEETDDVETRETAFLRICECLMRLKRFGETLERILAWEPPQAPARRARYLVVRAYALRVFGAAYSRILRQDVIDEEEREVYRLTPREIEDLTSETYRDLWALRRQLVEMETSEEDLIFNEESVDPGLYPTLFDYLITEWAGFLLNRQPINLAGEEDNAKVDATVLLVDRFDRPVDLSDPPALLAAELLEEAGRYYPEGRVQAGEHRKIQRLRLPSNYPAYFDFGGLVGDEPSRGEDALGVYEDRSKHILLGWMSAFRTDEARAEAGFQAALILRNRGNLVEAVDLCGGLVEEFSPRTRGGQCAEALRAGITRPELHLKTIPVMPPGTGAVTVRSKGLDSLYFRAYEVDPYLVSKGYGNHLDGHGADWLRRNRTWSRALDPQWLGGKGGQEWLSGFTSGREPYREWRRATTYKNNYREVGDVLDPPPLVPGMYLVFASGDAGFRMNESLLSAGFLNVTELVLVGSSGPTRVARSAYYDFIEEGDPGPVTDDLLRLYAFDALTGRPTRDVGVSALVFRPGWERNGSTLEELETEGDGSLSLRTPLGFKANGSSNLGVDPLARLDGSYAYWDKTLWGRHRVRNPLSIQLEIDRPIYRPGDEIRARAVVVKRTRGGFQTPGNGMTVDFDVRDANNKQVFSETLELGPFGSASISFVVPHGRLLGRYVIVAHYSDLGFHADERAFFSVEEYKRPEFEIMLEQPEEAWKYDQPVEIRGKAQYYFGGPVPDAPISYRIKRRRHVPYRYSHWFLMDFSREDREMAVGAVMSGPDGRFSIPFVPRPPADTYPWKIPDISQYTIEIEGRDAGGRTIEATRTYRAGKQSLYLAMEPAKGFFSEADTVKVLSERLTVNDVAKRGDGVYEVFSLGKAPEGPPEDERSTGRGWGRWEAPPLEVQLKHVPNAKLVAHGRVDHGEDGVCEIGFGPIPAGAYRVIEMTADAWGDSVSQERVVVVTGGPESAVMLDAYSVTLFEKPDYEVGDVARCVIGSGRGSGIYRVEVWSGEYLIDHSVASGEHAVRTIDVPVTDEVKGGLTLRWFGTRGLEVHSGQASVAVPWREKKLAIALDPFDSELEPGESYTWGVDVTDWRGRPARGEVLALMYDRSLEYYVMGRSRWLDALYSRQPARLDLAQSVFGLSGRDFYVKYPSHHCPGWPDPPKLRIHGSWYAPAGRIIGEGNIASLEWGDIHVRGGRTESFGSYDEAVEAPSALEYEERAGEIEARGEFADAAFFEPHLMTAEDGRAEFTFTAPEQLTAWRIKVFAHTGDVKEGSLVSEAVTRKDLIVRADLPRFLREGDEGTVTAVVHNESESALTGEVFVDITEGGESINGMLGLAAIGKRFSLEPHDLVAFDWRVKVPAGTGTYNVRVAAVSGGLSDAEERELPILPSRQRLIESRFAVLSGSESKKIEFEPGDDPTRENELMVLQIEPQLALSILNAMPFLVRYPYDCVEQSLNRYVPLSIVNEIYDDYPGIRKAVAKIPKRKTVVPAWEKDDPRGLMALMETPWVWQSEGRPTIGPLIDLLDPEIVAAHEEANLTRLREAQLPSGAFPWWPGGEADTYITLYVLAGFAEAKKFGVRVPDDMIHHAVAYLNDEILSEQAAWESRIPLIAYAGYVLTAYSPEEIPETETSHRLVRRWLGILDGVIGEMRPLPKAYVAYTHFRLGNETRAQEILDMALDGAREDPIVGVYWAPEKYSWVWYSDTVEKHAFFLRALQDMRPDDERLPGLVKWLLFNRKGNVWKSTKASAAAVYALLDYMRQRGALSGDEIFKVGWGGETYSAVVEADEWLEEPLRWEERGFEIGDDGLSASVEKDGPGTAFASLTWIYSTDQVPEASGEGLLQLDRRFYRRVKEGDEYHLKPISSGGGVAVGDQVEVHLKINSRSRFEYMHLKDMKASGFEAERLLSGWRYDPLGFYEEPRNSLTNFFLSRLPYGEYILRYRLRPTKPGVYRIGAATLQSMYAPEMTAHSAGFVIRVIP